MRRLLLLLLLTGWLATSAFAGGTWIVAAGVDKYEDAEISSLNYAVADVSALVDAFRATGVPADHIFLLTSDAKEIAQQSRRSTVLRVLQKVRERCDVEDTVLLFFSGHGMEKNGLAFLLTLDANRELLADTALPMSMVNSIAAGFRARSTLFIVDACRNDPDAGRATADAAMGDAFAKGVRPRELRGAAVLFACGVGQRAWEMPDAEHGAFTHYLLQGLAGEARAADGAVRLSSLAAYVAKEVPAWSERNKHPAQTPYLDNPEGPDIVLVQPGVQAMATGEVLVRSEPPGAQILFRGQNLGVTPATVKLPPGDQTLTLKHYGCEDATLRVTVRANELAQTEVGRLPPIPGTVTVTTDPPGAKVFVDGKDTGEVTPCVLKLPPGAVIVRVEQDGRESHEEQVAVAGAKTLRLPVWNLPEQAGPVPGWPAYLSRWNAQMPKNVQYRIRATDGMPQVLIPAGEFLMGSPDGQGETDEHPQRRVFVSAFWMDQHEVTVAQYRRFCQATGKSMASGNSDDTHPVVNVSWEDADAYAKWAGGSLPTEAQWEKAARGGTTTAYYWGDQWDAAKANSGGGTKPVGSYAPNGYGLFDIAGNVWDWCLDYYDGGWYAKMPSHDPCNKKAQGTRVLRGGSWLFVGATHARVADRHLDAATGWYVGDGIRAAGPAGGAP